MSETPTTFDILSALIDLNNSALSNIEDWSNDLSDIADIDDSVKEAMSEIFGKIHEIKKKLNVLKNDNILNSSTLSSLYSKEEFREFAIQLNKKIQNTFLDIYTFKVLLIKRLKSEYLNKENLKNLIKSEDISNILSSSISSLYVENDIIENNLFPKTISSDYYMSNDIIALPSGIEEHITDSVSTVIIESNIANQMITYKIGKCNVDADWFNVIPSTEYAVLTSDFQIQNDTAKIKIAHLNENSSTTGKIYDNKLCFPITSHISINAISDSANQNDEFFILEDEVSGIITGNNMAAVSIRTLYSEQFKKWCHYLKFEYPFII